MNIIRSLEDPALPLKHTAVALGIFDGVHTGHQAVLQTAVEAAKQRRLIPCVFTFALSTSGAPVKTGASHLASPGYMARLLEEMGMEYAASPVFEELRDLSGEEFASDFLAKILGAEFVCCGYDFRFGKERACDAKDLTRMAGALGIDCQVVPQVTEGGLRVSSTRIRECIAQGDMTGANQLLGRPFAIDFEVVYGNRIGRTLGSPTINQPFPEGFIIPRFGVYATLARVGDIWYSGVTNVGVKPTVGSNMPLAETYIHGFSGDLYGKQVEVAFLEFIRPEKRFGSLEELRANILRDAETAAGIAECYRRQHSLPAGQSYNDMSADLEPDWDFQARHI